MLQKRSELASVSFEACFAFPRCWRSGNQPSQYFSGTEGFNLFHRRVVFADHGFG
jgi:hypothetical protein